MKVGILGSGNVGLTLGTGFVEAGHEVMIASRNPQKETLKEWTSTANSPNAHAGTFAETAAFANLAIVATRWDGTQAALELAQPSNLAGKVVIDATNPLDFANGFPPTLAVGLTDSAGEAIQRWLPGAHVVKAFNTIGLEHMVNPNFPGGPPTKFICGNDGDAKRTVNSILSAFGWETVDAGDITASRYLEPLAMIWIRHSAVAGRNHAFKLLTR